MTVRRIPLALIDEPASWSPWWRPVDPAAVSRLRAQIAAGESLRKPVVVVEVGGRFVLRGGINRLAAARAAGESAVDAMLESAAEAQLYAPARAAR